MADALPIDCRFAVTFQGFWDRSRETLRWRVLPALPGWGHLNVRFRARSSSQRAPLWLDSGGSDLSFTDATSRGSAQPGPAHDP